MARTIAVSNEIYELMKNSKTEDESFSELIKRSIKRRPKLSSIAGKRTIDKKDWKMILIPSIRSISWGINTNNLGSSCSVISI